MRVVLEGMISDLISFVVSNVLFCFIKKSLNNIREKMMVNGWFFFFVFFVKVFLLKDDDIEFYDYENIRKWFIGFEEVKLRRLFLLESNFLNYFLSLGMKRRNGNMMSYEKML